MSTTNKSQLGFGTVEVVLIIVIIALIGFVGWFLYDKNSNKIAQSGAPPTATTTETTAKTADPYTGWKSYCDSSTDGCFKYPSDWNDVSPLDAQGIKAFGQNQAATINLEYSEPVTGNGGLGSFATKSLDSLTTANDSYRVVGGYYAVSNIPGYNLTDSSLVQKFELAIGKTSNVSDSNNLLFTKNSKRATLTVHFNNTTGEPSINATKADAWFNSADGKTALLIAQSFYDK